jgi:hypothetical protein
MAQKVDLLTLIKTFSHKSYSAIIETDTFIKFMEKNVQREDAAVLNIDDWKTDTRGKIIRGLSELASQGKVEVSGSGLEQKIIVNSFYTDIISRYYTTQLSGPIIPFPNEIMLRAKIPPDLVKTVNINNNFTNYIAGNSDSPNQIVKIIFGDAYGSAFTLASFLPQRLLEVALQKIEYCLRTRSEMEYYAQKLMIHFKGQEIRIRSFVNVLTSRPLDNIKSIEESSDFTYSVWLFLCPLIRKHIEELAARVNECTPVQVALVQAAIVVMAINNYYQVNVLNKRNKDMALGAVYERLGEIPYIFSLSDIINFTGASGAPLNQRYSEQELDSFLKEKTAFTSEAKLPDLLKFKGRDGTEWFVRKQRVWPLCSKLMTEVQPQIKNEITGRWMRILKDYRRENAMDKDSDFEELLERFCNFFSPQFLLVAHDKKIGLLQEELLVEHGSLPKGERLFEGDRPVPLKILLRLRREDIIYSCKLSLPFWYSITVLVKLIGVFKGKGKKEKINTAVASKKTSSSTGGETLRDSAEKLMKVFVPAGSNIDSYLESIRDRWNQLLDKQAQKKLTEDVHAITRAHLNHVLKLQKPNSFDNQMLEDNADQIINMNAALDRITNKNALRLYIKVLITKFLLSHK